MTARSVLPLLLALASGTAAAQAPPLRVIHGRVLTSVRRNPVAGAIVDIPGIHIGAFADSQGVYTLRNAPDSALHIRAAAIGYLPCVTTIPAGADSTEIDVFVIETPHSPPDPARFPLTDDEKRDIWRALLIGLGSRRDDHFATLARVVPSARIHAPTGRSTTVLMSPHGAQDVPAWLGSLQREHTVAAVCRDVEAAACRLAGYHYYANLGDPARFASDSALVPVVFTDGDLSLCGKDHAVYDRGNMSYLLAREGAQWRFLGQDQSAGFTIGGIYC